MFEVLVVDDEAAAIKSIKYVIDWESIGFRIKGEAANGEQALQLFAEQSYDLVITDIRMPKMDGLQLVSELRKRSDVPVMILSGYEDFKYAQRGIELGVKEYLLKPADAEELLAKIGTLKQQLERQRLDQQKMYRGLPLMREQLLRKWVNGEIKDPHEFMQLEILPNHDQECFCVMMVEMSQAKTTESGMTDVELKRFAIQNVIEELCRDVGLLFRESSSRYGIVGWGSGKVIGEEPLYQLAQQIIEAVKRYTKESVEIAIGPVVTSRFDVKTSYQEALSLLEKKNLFAETGFIYLFDHIQRNKDSQHLIIEEVKRAVRERFHENIELKEIAQQLYLNPNYLGILFRSHTGISFKDYLLKVRMEIAKDLLLYTNKKVYEIARHVGYKEIDWFYKKFKQYFGISANGYRAK